MEYDIALEMSKYLKEIYKLYKNASKEEIVESDLPNLIEKFVRKENYIGSGGNNAVFRYDGKVLLIPHRFNPLNEKARTPISPENVFEVLKKQEEENRDSTYAESSIYRFRDIKNSDKYHESLPIAIWGGEGQGQNIQLMEYLGEPSITEDQRTPSAAQKNMDIVFKIITDDAKIERALDRLKEIKDLGYETDPKPDNLTIDPSGEVRFIDLNPLNNGLKRQPLDYFIYMLLPPYIFKSHPEKEKYKDQVRRFIKKAYEYGKSIGLDEESSIEETFSKFNFATEEELDILKENKRLEEEQKELERQRNQKEEMSPQQKEDASNLIFSIGPSFKAYNPDLYSDVSFLKGIVEEELYLLIQDLRSGNLRTAREISKYFAKNPDAIYEIDLAAKENLRMKESLNDSDTSKEDFIKESMMKYSKKRKKYLELIYKISSSNEPYSKEDSLKNKLIKIIYMYCSYLIEKIHESVDADNSLLETGYISPKKIYEISPWQASANYFYIDLTKDDVVKNILSKLKTEQFSFQSFDKFKVFIINNESPSGSVKASIDGTRMHLYDFRNFYKKNVDKIIYKSAIQHELEHMVNSGASQEDFENDEFGHNQNYRYLKYFTEEGEVKSYAKQLAYILYKNNITEFDIDKDLLNLKNAMNWYYRIVKEPENLIKENFDIINDDLKNKIYKASEDFMKFGKMYLYFFYKKEDEDVLENIKKESAIKYSKKRKLTSKPSSEKNLRDWFKRKGPKGSTGGWVDCNTCRNGKCKPCGRQEGEKRKEYPACRPTPAACKKYKATKGKSWGKGGKRKASFEHWYKVASSGTKTKEIKDYKDLIKLDQKELDKMNIFLDNPIGTSKSFYGSDEIKSKKTGRKEYKERELPFDYGEIEELINPADNMGWDIIIVPSQSGNDKNQTFEGYKFVGIVKYTEDKDEWKKRDIKSPKTNYKLIISIDGEYEDSDVDILEDFFDDWMFEKIDWF